jgi:predicted secreted protein
MPLLGKGSTLGVDDGASGYENIAGVDSLTFDAGTADQIDVTDWDSDGYEELIGGIKRGGSVTFQTNADPAASTGTTNYDLIHTLHASQAVKEFKLQIGATPAATITFDGILTNYSLDIPTGDKVVTSVTISTSGAPTWS